MSESHSSGVLQGERTSSPTKVSFWRLAGESPADATGTLDQLEKRPVEKRQRVEFVRTVPEQGKQPLENLVAGHCLTEGEFNLPDEGVSILNSRIREMEGQLASSLTGIGPSTFSQKIANRNDSNAVLNDAGKLGSKRGGTRKSTRKTDERWDEMFQQVWTVSAQSNCYHSVFLF